MKSHKTQCFTPASLKLRQAFDTLHVIEMCKLWRGTNYKVTSTVQDADFETHSRENTVLVR